jgi:nucleoporin POM152
MATPRRVTGGYPQTPSTVVPPRARRSEPAVSTSMATPQPKPAPLPVVPSATRPNNGSQPVIPLTLIDAPQQRFYAFASYVLLLGLRLLDWKRLAEDDEASWALFLKWVVIDLVFLFGLPELRIPWLELSQPVVMTAFVFHAIINWMLMFNIPV